MSKAPPSEAEKTDAPLVVVFDPSDDWPDGLARVPIGAEVLLSRDGLRARLLRVQAGSLPPCSLVLVVSPRRGLDRSERRTVEPIDRTLCPLLLLATVGDDMLIHVSRGGLGFEQLVREANEQYSAKVVLCSPSSPTVLSDIERLIVVAAAAAARKLEILRQFASLTAIVELLLEPVATTTGLVRMARRWDRVVRLERAQLRWRALEQHLQEANHSLRNALDDWALLANGTYDRCLARARGVEYFGAGAEDIVGGVVDALEDVRHRLDLDFAHPPLDALASWANRARMILDVPAVILPVVGIFSCGKTTLLNHLIGVGEDLHALLRTAWTHNTALLLQFVYRRFGRPNLVQFHWREKVNITLASFGDESARPVSSPVAGRVECVERMPDGSQLLRVHAQDEQPRWITIPTWRRLLPGIRNGTMLRIGTVLTDGISEAAELPQLLQGRTSIRVTVRSRAVVDFLKFIKEGRFLSVSLEVKWREPLGRKAWVGAAATARALAITPQTHELTTEKGTTDEFCRVVLEDLVGHCSNPESETSTFEPSDAERVPVKVCLVAELDPSRCIPRSHELQSPADWSWFQGPAKPQTQHAPREVGFAESPEAAWLVDSAEVQLDNPLFRLASLVDTPGLNSISEDHDRITEEFIQRGQVFVLMARLGRDTWAEATDAVISMICRSLTAQNVPQPEWSKRVLVVLNWFRTAREAGARNEGEATKNATQFIDRLRSALHGEPRAYVVDLSGQAEVPMTLLGKPSLPALRRDLRTILASWGISARLTDLERELDRLVQEAKGAIQDDLRDLEGTTSEEDRQLLKRVSLDFAPGGPARAGLYEMVKQPAEEMNEALKAIYLELGREYEDALDFEQAADAVGRSMRAFNRARLDLLEGMVTPLASRLRSGLKNVVAPPLAIRPDVSQNPFPAFQDSFFEERARKVVAGWPSKWSRFWHAVTSWEYYAETQRKQLRAEFFRAKKQKSLVPLEQSIELIVAAYGDAIRASCDAVQRLIRDRLAATEIDDEKRAERSALLSAKAIELERFEDKVRNMRQVLSKSAATIEG